MTVSIFQAQNTCCRYLITVGILKPLNISFIIYQCQNYIDKFLNQHQRETKMLNTIFALVFCKVNQILMNASSLVSFQVTINVFTMKQHMTILEVKHMIIRCVVKIYNNANQNTYTVTVIYTRSEDPDFIQNMCRESVLPYNKHMP